MEASKFTQKIYGPYDDAWKLIKILSKADEGSPALSEILHRYMSGVQAFKEKYHDNAFAMELYELLKNADTDIMRVDRE